ncbi:MAG: HAMP domain-containing histidine kinase [Lachnospiraceae bacterium]|nr:HAMP domain-containing histidine kinase [Lachnospiraceae bacterium]
MKELKKKTYFTLLIILSLILITVLILVNIRGYLREKESVERSLNILDDRGGFRNDRNRPVMGDKTEPDKDQKARPSDLENMMVMDYELYTVELEDGKVSEIFSHGNSSSDFDVESIAADIVSKETSDHKYIGNLYLSLYSYRYTYMDSIVILNDKEIKDKLIELLIESFILFIIMEALIAFISNRITLWITKPAKQAFEKQREFIADASHELKTPLAVIMASADDLSVSEEDEKKLENIRYESERMSKLISGLLNLSRLENGDENAEHKEEDLSRILEKTCLVYEGVAFEQGVSILADIDEGLSLKCNKDEIEQMASTILDNAVRHSYKDTAVEVTARKNKGIIDIQVINSGQPIPDEEREKIFERFYRGDKARSRDDNRYGLGLAIARRIARNHNGDIQAYSRDGKTVFKITLR